MEDPGLLWLFLHVLATIRSAVKMESPIWAGSVWELGGRSQQWPGFLIRVKKGWQLSEEKEISYREQLLKEEQCFSEITLLPGLKVNGIFFGSLTCPIPFLGKALKTIWGTESGSLRKPSISQMGVMNLMVLLMRWTCFSLLHNAKFVQTFISM